MQEPIRSSPTRNWPLALCLLVSVAWPAGGQYQADRSRLRAQRAAVRQAAAEDRRARVVAATRVIGRLMAVAEAGPVAGCREDLAGLVAGLVWLGGDGEALWARVRAIEVSAADPAAIRAWAGRVTEARATLTQRPLELLRRAEAMGVVEVAVDAMREVLRFDPDHAVVRRGLGQVKVDGGAVAGRTVTVPVDEVTVAADLPALLDPDANWMSRFEADMLGRGLVWDPSLGWVVGEHRDRYEQGYVYDFQRRRWSTLDEANRVHGRLKEMWEIRTEHLLVRGTADLRSLAEVATKLEAFYDRFFATFPALFEGGQYGGALRLAVGLAEHPPLVVYVLHDRETYQQLSGGPGWSVGLYKPGRRVSFFFGGPSRVMYHEFTHQLLHVFSGTNKAPSWLTEAIAMYTQFPMLDGDRLRFVGIDYSNKVPVGEVMRLRTVEQWKRAARRSEHGAGAQYEVAGAVATFCMDAEGGRFRDDFLDYLRDAYRGAAGGDDLWDYLGLSRSAFEAAYHRWGAGAGSQAGGAQAGGGDGGVSRPSRAVP